MIEARFKNGYASRFFEEKSSIAAKISAALLFFVFPIVQIVSHKSAPLFLGLSAIISLYVIISDFSKPRTPTTKSLRKLLNQTRSIPAPLMFAILFVLWMTISTLWSPLPSEGLKKSLTVSAMILCAFVNVKNLQKVDSNLIYIMCLTGITVAIIVLFFELLKITEFYKFFPRTRLHDYNRNIIYMSLCGVTLLFSLQLKPPNNFIIYVFFGLIIALTFISSSESSKLAVLAVGFCVIALKTTQKMQPIIYLSLAASFLIAPIVVNYSQRHLEIIREYTGNNVTPRIELWGKHTARLHISPIIGFGAGAGKHLAEQEEVYFHVRKKGKIVKQVTNHGHGSVIQIWYDLGLIGVLICVAFFLSIGLYASKHSTLMFNAITLTTVSLHFSTIAGASFYQGWSLATIAIITTLLVSLLRPSTAIDSSENLGSQT